MAANLDEESNLEESQVNLELSKQKFKQILKSNGILDLVSEVIIKDAGLRGQVDCHSI